ncbi:universal stress protein [Tunturiibacter gelidiferens]|uniref:universal stress protein n=1 Tax=Tunturiibacter gelidiferens TaxID=3069689 RepID=UPI003D9AD337
MTQVLPQIFAENRYLAGLRKIVVGHDFSETADHALVDAMALADRFNAEIVIAHIEPREANDFKFRSSDERDDRTVAEMENRLRRVALAGHQCRKIIRFGDAAKMLAEIAQEEGADLLLLGAYGDGPKDRKTLGRTAELLLRSVPCPILTDGPEMTRSLFQNKEPLSILVPIELPCDPRHLIFAVSVSKLFKAKLEILHVVDMNQALSMPHAFQDMQYTCEHIATFLRQEGVSVAGSLLFGNPAAAILSRSQELHSSLIMMPLETRGFLSSTTSDNVAANVIRSAQVPVMTYRLD